jgi:predicted nicotinamide N-methyase
LGVATSTDLWYELEIADELIQLMNLEHPEVHRRVIAEIDAGIDVYYDSRWKATEQFGRLLFDQPELVAGRSILIVGAGVGLETVIIGKLCRKLYLNDLAPVSLELCIEQLERNGLTDVSVLPGRFEAVDLPDVDLIVGCFVIYERETREAMETLLGQTEVPVLLVNEELDAFRSLMQSTRRAVERIDTDNGSSVVILR